MKIRLKILIYIIGTAALTFIAAIGYISFKSRQSAFETVQERLKETTLKSAKEIEASLNTYIGVCRGIANAFNGYNDYEPEQREVFIRSTLKSTLESNTVFTGSWVSWELSAFINNWSKPYGRDRFQFFKESGNLRYQYDRLNTEGDDLNGAYYKIKLSKLETILEPYAYAYRNRSKQILETSICIPIIDKTKFVGLMGVDISLENLQSLINEINPYRNSYAFFVSNQGTVVSHPDQENIGESVDVVYPEQDDKFEIKENIKNGNVFSFIDSSDPDNVRFINFAPVQMGRDRNHWSVAIVVPQSSVIQKVERDFIVSNIVGILGLLILSMVVLFMANRVSNPLNETITILKALDLGIIDKSYKISVKTNDETAEMADSVNRLIDTLNGTAEFATHIGKGNLDAPYKMLSEHDTLGKALLDMKNSLQQAKIAEQERKVNDEMQSWATQGYAEFSDLLRISGNDLSKLSYKVVSSLVKYVNANQGGLFLTNDSNDAILELMAAYAYDRKRLVKRKISKDEGLTGRCFDEAETIYLRDIPDDYVHITSGLGEAKPRNLLLVPLKLNSNVLGVLEVASFNLFKTHEIEFIEKVAESIAATVSGVKINMRTEKLLLESNLASEELASKEEEMVQNMEMLEATQEEFRRREESLKLTLKSVTNNLFYMEIATDSIITRVNDNYLILKRTIEASITNKYHAETPFSLNLKPSEYEEFWNKLRNGIPQKKNREIRHLNNVKTMLVEHFMPVVDENDIVIKIICLGFETSI